MASAGTVVPALDRPAMVNDEIANFTSSLPRGSLRSRQSGNVSPWAGSVQEGSGWTFVTGTSVVPSVYNQGNAGAATWVGIDGESCGRAIIQTGFTNWGNGAVETWYEWWPNPSYTYRGVSAKAGDTIRMSVWAYGTRSGKVLLENLSTGQSDYRTFDNMNAELCLTDAEWIVEQFTDTSSGNHVYLANFGTIDITNTQAKGNRGTVGADGGNIVEIYDGNQQMTSCGTNNYGVECRYIG
ncbi:hypothetical protein V2A60_009323 [Cordyceps javanica]|uniref:Peptidase A4 family protein n=1 Tax=Cordyceps javanica TaxID=43265 RepID=A0A545UKP8_9HYPO|nr:peptidase A4 family protein [Cordyceps javanica]TQW02184.1 peptidase A4 family protein [Cordyceps javanica]